MPANRFSVLLWQDFHGRYTACLVTDPQVAAVAPTASDAVRQLKDYLEWAGRHDPFPPPDFRQPQLVQYSVEIRPEYADEKRIFPCEQTVRLRVPCVQGKDSFGTNLCAIPTLALQLNYYDARSLKGLIAHKVQAALSAMTPREVSRRLPPCWMQVDEIVVQSSDDRWARESDVSLTALPAVADPVGLRGFRSGLSRPWERDVQVAALVQKLRGERASVLLVGPSGAGKTAILAEAVRKIEREGAIAGEEPDEDEPELAKQSKKGKQFWMTSAARLIAGMQYLGQWQERCEEVIDELSQIGGALCVENLLDLLKSGGQGPGDGLAAFLAPFVQRRELQLVAETTPEELDACRRLLSGFAELFQVVHVPALGRAEAIAALDRVAATLRQNLRIELERGVVELVYRLFARFMPYYSFPGPASQFLAAVFDRALRDDAAVTQQRVIDAFIRHTGLPELFLRNELLLEHGDVVATLQERVIGQGGACAAAANVITTFKAGLNDPARPIAVLLFCGPTGVGKTELARAIAGFLFGQGETRDRMVRLDMSEYAGPGSAERLVSDSRGEPSELVNRLRRQPFTLLLLDEIEKASPEVFDVLLSVFDEGRLSDRYGRVTTFCSSVIVMTSNLGAGAAESFGLARQSPPDYDAEAREFFRPEFFNRIDAVVQFSPLEGPSIRAIVEKELAELARREGFMKSNLRLEWTERVVDHLAQLGFDRRYGARPLQRAIESLLVTPLSRFLITRQMLRGETIRADLDAQGRLVIETA